VTRVSTKWADLTRIQQRDVLALFRAGLDFQTYAPPVELFQTPVSYADRPAEPDKRFFLADLDVVLIAGDVTGPEDPLIVLIVLTTQSLPAVMRGILTPKGRRALYHLEETTHG
jgi:hypothetical protein